MRSESNRLIFFFFLFILLNIFLYAFIILFHSKLSFDSADYGHFISDFRLNGTKNLNLVNLPGAYDSQWYLRIADIGYPKNPVSSHKVGEITNGWTYLFFPLYPILVHVINILVKNLQISAFLFTNILLVADFFSLYFLVSKIYSRSIALKSIFLLFLFPFGIFYRSYFAEGLYLLIAIWFVYFLLKKRFILSALFLGLLNITNGNGMFLNIYFLYQIYIVWKNHMLSLKRGITVMVILVLPFLAWMFFCFWQTGNFLYFLANRKDTFPLGHLPIWVWMFINPIYNFIVILDIPSLPLHSFHYSRVDAFFVLLCLLLLIKSKKYLKNPFWWFSFSLWLTPLLVKDMMSFSRFQSLSFPLFIYAASVLKGKWYFLTLLVFVIGLLALSLLFVNWYWIG